MRNLPRATLICLLAGLSLAVPAWSQSTSNTTTTDNASELPDLLAQLARTGKYTTLLKALDNADLMATLSQDGPYTLFAPSDNAFKLLPTDMLQRLRKDKVMLRRILLYHVAQGKISAKTASEETYTESYADSNLHFVNYNGQTFVDNARIVHGDIEARNGVIHEIDRVLIPPTVKP